MISDLIADDLVRYLILKLWSFLYSLHLILLSIGDHFILNSSLMGKDTKVLTQSLPQYANQFNRTHPHFQNANCIDIIIH